MTPTLQAKLQGARFVLGFGASVAGTMLTQAAKAGFAYSQNNWAETPCLDVGLTDAEKTAFDSRYANRKARVFVSKLGVKEIVQPTPASTVNFDPPDESTVMKAAAVFCAAIYGVKALKMVMPKVLPYLPSIPKLSLPFSLPKTSSIGEKLVLGAIGLFIASRFE